MNYLRLEYKRMLKCRTFILSLIFSAAIVLLDVGQDYSFYMQGIDHHTPVFEKWIGVRYISYGSVVWNFLFVILVSVPFSCTLCSEIKNHYDLHVISKIGKKKYFSVKVFISFISGFLISIFTLVLDFLLLALYNKASYPEVDSMSVAIGQNDFLSVYFYSHPYIYCTAWLLIICIWAGIFSVFTLTVGLFVRKASIALIVAQILVIFQDILSRFNPVFINGSSVELSWMGLLYGDSLALNPWFTIFGNQLALLLFCMIAICWKGKRYSYV